MSETVIQVENVSKVYKLYNSPKDRLKEALNPFRKSYHSDFYALNNINITIQKGEIIGFIGQNGSGKSTLLKIITGVLNPSSGKVNVKGKVASLLELGTGFNPDLTGRENIFFYGTIHGLTQPEIFAQYESIVTFADIGEFIEQPVKTYSSGMFVRLAFACAIQVNPEIIIIDEALSVGDAKFQAKCFSRLKKLMTEGKTIIFVTHSMEQIITHCDRAYLLVEGVVHSEGVPKDIVNIYLDRLFGSKQDDRLGSIELESTLGSANVKSLFEDHPLYNKNEFRWGDKRAILESFSVKKKEVGDDFAAFQHGDRIELTFNIRSYSDLKEMIFGFAIKTIEGITIYNTNTEINGEINWKLKKEELKQVKVSFNCNMYSGDFFISVGLSSRNENQEVIPHDRRYDCIHIKILQVKHFFGIVDLETQFEVLK